MAIEQQMQLFALGGLDDDGMSRDPVSGNTIPAGSMANEVRDDVDAKLSDGEYVVPANVVRFFGVKFFEDLRTQAMQGLGAMEANGRIGGEPVPSAMPMQDQMANVKPDMSDGEMEMLQGLMNEGGFIRGYAHGGSHEIPETASTAYNPLQYPLTQYATPGASVYNQNLNPNAQALEQTQTAAPTPAGSESTFVTFVNPRTGTIQVLQYINGEPANIDAYNSLTEQGFFVQGGPELAAYEQQQNQDNRDSDAQMGGDKAKTLQDLIESSIYGGISLGPGSAVAGSIIGKMFPTKSDQDIIDYIIANDGKMPNTGRGVPLRDANGNVVLNAGGTPKFKTHETGPFKGLIVRAPGKDGEVKLSEAELAYVKNIEAAKKDNIKNSVFNNKGFRIDGLGSDILKEGGGLLGKLNVRALNSTEIDEWYKTQPKKTKPKGGPVAATSTRSLDARDSTGTKFKDYEYKDDGQNLTSKGRTDLLKDVEEKYNLKLQSRGPVPSQPRSNFRDDDNDNNQGTTASVTKPNTVTYSQKDDKGRPKSGTGTAKDKSVTAFQNTAGGRFMNKGGLIKKPKKKKTKKY